MSLRGVWEIWGSEKGFSPKGTIKDTFLITEDGQLRSQKEGITVYLERSTDRQKLFPGYWGWFNVTIGNDKRYLALNRDGSLTIHRFNEQDEKLKGESFFGEPYHDYEIGIKGI